MNFPRRVKYMTEQKISKNHLLHNVDKCTSINELYKLVRENEIRVQMQTLHGASNIPPKKKLTPAEISADNTYLDRLKRSVMQAIEDQYPEK